MQEELTRAVNTVIQANIELTGCGRTDTGVHATHFVAHFDAAHLPENPQSRINGLLPDDISVDGIYQVADSFHARFDAVEREYHYRITPIKNVFEGELMYLDRRIYDVKRMNEGCELIKSATEFGAFCKLHSENKTNRCDVRHAEWTQSGHELRFTVRADRFLRNMVRAMVGTLLDLGLNKITLADLNHILRSQDRSAAGRSVPAKGLMLSDVVYDRTNWRRIKDEN